MKEKRYHRMIDAYATYSRRIGRVILPGMPLAALLVLLALLAGCGVTTGSSTTLSGSAPKPPTTVTPGSSTPTPTAMPTSTFPPSSTTSVGNCPTAEQPADAALPPADIIVSPPFNRIDPQPTTVTQTINVKVGQTVEFRMPASEHWTMNLNDSGATLQAQGDRGWYDAAHKACVWRFLVVSAGSPVAVFAGATICKPPEMCPDTIFSLDFHLAITAG